MTGSELDDVALAAVHRRTDGNPFFVIELLRTPPAAHEDRPGSASAHSADPARRQGRRPPTRRTASRNRRSGRSTFAAALGQAFDLAVLAASVDIDGATLLDHLEPALVGGCRRRQRRWDEPLPLRPRPRQRDDLPGHGTGAARPHPPPHRPGARRPPRRLDRVPTCSRWPPTGSVPCRPHRSRIAVEHALEAAAWGADHVAHQGAIEQLHARARPHRGHAGRARARRARAARAGPAQRAAHRVDELHRSRVRTGVRPHPRAQPPSRRPRAPRPGPVAAVGAPLHALRRPTPASKSATSSSTCLAASRPGPAQRRRTHRTRTRRTTCAATRPTLAATSNRP